MRIRALLIGSAAVIGSAAIVATGGCNDPYTGGNVSNGDPSNTPEKGLPDGRDVSPSPIGNQSGPWIQEHGLTDTTTHSESVDRAKPSQATTATTAPSNTAGSK
jgi:hypothetical protein